MATAAPPQADAPPDPKSYYGYLIADDKTPTPLFAAFLRALAQHIIDNVGDTTVKQLSPPKLAAFYKLAGCDYDDLFLKQSNPSISFTWQTTGCQHSLQPTDDAFKPPSIPVLTTKGFISWQTLQTLLFPDVHVPVLQFAAKTCNLKHPETGEAFPPDLPKEALPSVPDPKIEEWHLECGRRLQREAAEAERAKQAQQAPKPQPESPRSTSVPRTRTRPIFKQADYFYSARMPREERSDSPRAPRARNSSPRPGMSGMDGPDARAYSFHHVQPHFTVPGTGATQPSVFAAATAATAAAKFARKVRLSPPADEHRAGRRRSFSDYPPSPTPGEPRVRVHSPHIHTETHNFPPRRHSHPHHHYRSSSDTSGSDDEEIPPHVPPRGGRPIHIPVPRADDPPMPSVRRGFPPGPTVLPDPYPPGPIHAGKRESSSSGGDRERRRRDERERVPFPNVSRSPRRSPHRSPHRTEEPRRRSRGVSGNIQDKLSSILPNGVVGAISNMTKTERPRSSSRTHSHSSEQGSGAQRYSKESLQGSKLGREWSYDSDDGNGGSTNGDRHRHRDRDFDRERERERPRRDYDRDRDPRDPRDPRDLRDTRDTRDPRDRDPREYRRDREVPFRPRDKDAEHDRERDRDRHPDPDRYRDRERERDTYILDRGRRDSLREKKKNKSLDRSREHSREPREPREEPERPDDDREYRSRRDRERYPLRPDTLKRPVVSPDVER